MDEKMSRVKAIKAFFAKDGGTVVTAKELIALTTAERHELGDLAAAELGVELEVTRK